MQPSLVSIMMPAYNADPYIGAAIESVLAQTYSAWELLIVDDGSTDGTGDVMKRYHDQRIRSFRQPNAGESVARNRALAETQGEFVAFLDADDFFQPDHIANLVDHLQRHTEVEGVYTDGYYCNSADVPLARLSSRRRGPFTGDIYPELVLASDVFGPPLCVMVRTAPIAERQLRFDPAIVIGPDWDFFTRLAAFTRFGYVDATTCFYRVHDSNITVRVPSPKRLASLALCRTKAIKSLDFARCTLATRTAVFYDLLVNLLHGQYAEQEDVTGWPAFAALPAGEQARLYRLMASSTMSDSALWSPFSATHIKEWLTRARARDQSSLSTRILSTLYALSPDLCRASLRLRHRLHRRSKPAHTQPFEGLA